MSTSWDSEDSFWKRTALYSAIAVAVVAAGGAIYYFEFMKKPVPPVAPPAAQAPAGPAAETEKEHHPIAGAPDRPLPKLNESDSELGSALAGVFGKGPIDQMLVPEMVIRHVVVTVDNLPRNKVAEQMRPVKSIGGDTVVVTSGDSTTLGEENAARYAAVMKLVQTVDIKQLGSLYIRYYPLFQQSYEDLGYPGQYFNDRLVEVIDHLLQTPDIRGPIELKQGKVFYEYADPALEARSAGQKLLLRMGPRNQATIKAKLKELRVYVTTSQDPPADVAAPAAAPGAVAAPGEAAAPASDAPAAVKPDSVPEATPAPK
ncbi:MAG: DUF3014 domain-containing protein [Gammaproteobacteria bacterium]